MDHPKDPGFLVRSRCGRSWFVPLEAVGRDYAKFLEEQDGMSPEKAMEASSKERDFWPSWFAEQCCDWSTIESLGILVEKSALPKTKKALDRLRTSRVEDYEEIEIEQGLMSLREREALEKGAGSAKSSGSKGPRL